MEQAKRIFKVFGLTIVSRLMYITACALKLFKQDVEAEVILLECFKTSLKAMNALDDWNNNRRVLDLATSFKIRFYQANLKVIIQELEDK